ncbi:hypothetical protein K7432_006292 [Basidiobolus ranarum]|uniref:Uncharacterized protein n=1 Tax=Basidiobolus ranarum TaxID=34480 RepID=A0ABR2W207_9FUNG
MSSQIDTRISKLKDFISYFAPGNVVEYGSFVQTQQITNQFLENHMSSVGNSGYDSCVSKTSSYTSSSISPRSGEESLSSPDSNPNPTPRSRDSLINSSSSDKASNSSFLSNKRPRQGMSGKSLSPTKNRRTGGKLYRSGKVVRPTGSGKQIPYHGHRMISTSDDSDTESASESTMSVDSWDEDEVLLGSAPIEIKRALHRKQIGKAIQIENEEDDTIIVDDIEIEGNTGELTPKLLRSRSSTPELGTPQVLEVVKPKGIREMTLKKQLIVRLKIISHPQERSLIIRLQLPQSSKSPLGPISAEAICGASSYKVAAVGNDVEEELLAGQNIQPLCPSDSNIDEASMPGGDQQKGATLINTLLNHLLTYDEIEAGVPSYEEILALASTAKQLFAEAVEQHVSSGKLGVAGLIMKLESIFIFRLLNFQSKLLSGSSVEMGTQPFESQKKFLESVELFTDDFESITRKWNDADNFLKRETSLYAKQSKFTIFSGIFEMVEFIKTQALL